MRVHKILYCLVLGLNAGIWRIQASWTSWGASLCSPAFKVGSLVSNTLHFSCKKLIGLKAGLLIGIDADVWLIFTSGCHYIKYLEVNSHLIDWIQWNWKASFIFSNCVICSSPSKLDEWCCTQEPVGLILNFLVSKLKPYSSSNKGLFWPTLDNNNRFIVLFVIN